MYNLNILAKLATRIESLSQVKEIMRVPGVCSIFYNSFVDNDVENSRFNTHFLILSYLSWKISKRVPGDC